MPTTSCSATCARDSVIPLGQPDSIYISNARHIETAQEVISRDDSMADRIHNLYFSSAFGGRPDLVADAAKALGHKLTSLCALIFDGYDLTQSENPAQISMLFSLFKKSFPRIRLITLHRCQIYESHLEDVICSFSGLLSLSLEGTIVAQDWPVSEKSFKHSVPRSLLYFHHYATYCAQPLATLHWLIRTGISRNLQIVTIHMVDGTPRAFKDVQEFLDGCGASLIGLCLRFTIDWAWYRDFLPPMNLRSLTSLRDLEFGGLAHQAIRSILSDPIPSLKWLSFGFTYPRVIESFPFFQCRCLDDSLSRPSAFPSLEELTVICDGPSPPSTVEQMFRTHGFAQTVKRNNITFRASSILQQ